MSILSSSARRAKAATGHYLQFLCSGTGFGWFVSLGLVCLLFPPLSDSPSVWPFGNSNFLQSSTVRSISPPGSRARPPPLWMVIFLFFIFGEEIGAELTPVAHLPLFLYMGCRHSMAR